MAKKDVDIDFLYGHRCANRAIDFLEKHGDEDFFLSLSFDEPHGPFLCPPPYAHMYDDYYFPERGNENDSLVNKPEHQKVWAESVQSADDREKRKNAFKYFLGCNSYVDYEIGRVVDAIKKHADDAVIIYTSDHGDFMGSHGLNGKGPAAYEEISRIPFIISGADVPKNKVSGAPVSHINIAPTVFELMGFEIPAIFEGKSLLPQIKDPESRVNDYVFIEFGRYEVDHDGFGAFQPLRAVFDGKYKLIINLMTSDELYDLENDQIEMNNLINVESLDNVRERLLSAILHNMNETRDPFRGYYWETRDWRKDTIKPTWKYTNMTRQRDEETYESHQLDYDTGLPVLEFTRQKN